MPSDNNETPKRVRGRSALLAHAMAQRENRLTLERRDARSRLEERSGRPVASEEETPRNDASRLGSHRSDADWREPGHREPGRPSAARDERPQTPLPESLRPRGLSTPRPQSAVAELNRPKPRQALIDEALAARRRTAEPTGLDAMVAEALGKTAGRHQGDDGFDRQSALTDLIARTQARLGTADSAAGKALRPEAPSRAADDPRPAVRPSGPKLDREAAIAEAMRTHRARQDVFDELTVRQRATLRAAAEAMVDRRAAKK